MYLGQGTGHSRNHVSVPVQRSRDEHVVNREILLFVTGLEAARIAHAPQACGNSRGDST